MHRKLSNVFQSFCQVKPGKEFSEEITGHMTQESHEKILALSLNHFQGSKGNENQTSQIQASLSSVPGKKHPIRYMEKH